MAWCEQTLLPLRLDGESRLLRQANWVVGVELKLNEPQDGNSTLEIGWRSHPLCELVHSKPLAGSERGATAARRPIGIDISLQLGDISRCLASIITCLSARLQTRRAPKGQRAPPTWPLRADYLPASLRILRASFASSCIHWTPAQQWKDGEII